MIKPKHDHRGSLWAVGLGFSNPMMLWCYQCGAYKFAGQKGWNKPTGIGGENPALLELRKKYK